MVGAFKRLQHECARGCCPNIVDGLTTKASRVVNLEVLALPRKYGFPETNMLGKPATWGYKMKPGV